MQEQEFVFSPESYFAFPDFASFGSPAVACVACAVACSFVAPWIVGTDKTQNCFSLVCFGIHFWLTRIQHLAHSKSSESCLVFLVLSFLRGRVTESVLEDLRILILEELETLTLDVEQELESEQEGEPVLAGTVKALMVLVETEL